jgi:OOP family OmpA-OmpF porin
VADRDLSKVHRGGDLDPVSGTRVTARAVNKERAMKARKWKVLSAVIFCGLAVVLSGSAPAATEDDPKGELGGLIGAALPDSDIPGGSGWDEIRPAFGLRFAAFWNDQIAWFADGTYSRFNSQFSTEGAGVYSIRTGPEFLSKADAYNWRYFVNFAPGWMNMEQPGDLGFGRPFASVGVGGRNVVNPHYTLRWEIRGDYTLNTNGFNEKSIFNMQALLGFAWAWGGRPKDSDGDGVPDKRDACPNTPAGARVDDKGCPFDSDGDGVFDGIDQCPNTPKGATVDAKGCPLDSDGDGVYDGIDQCANTPRGVKVDTRGCPLDSDGDGVNDALDKCPDTPRGTKVGPDGCPLPPPVKPLFEEGKKSLVLEGVNFEFNSDRLTAESSSILQRVAESLKSYPATRVEIGGHTDSTGADAYNMKLSQRRAESVRTFLVQNGVNADQLMVKGYGESRPVADNKTEGGRAKNRRVELTKLN